MLQWIQRVINREFEITGSKTKLLSEKNTKQEVKFSTKGPYLLYKFECNGNIDMPILNLKEPGVGKIADYVLFTTKEETLYVLVFELKNGRGNPNKQLKATIILAQYLVETAIRISKEEFNTPQYRGIGLAEKGEKQKTRPNSKNIYKDGLVRLSGIKSISIDELCC